MRVFVALWPPPPVVDELARLDRPPMAALRWTTADQWHVTLRFLGEIGGEEVERGKAALDRLGSRGRMARVAAVAGPALELLSPTVWCLPVAGLADLAEAVCRSTAEIGAPVGDRRFRGHLTMARGKGVAALAAAPAVALTASWPVDEVTLVASELHPRGARYRVIHRVPISGRSDRGEGGAVADDVG